MKKYKDILKMLLAGGVGIVLALWLMKPELADSRGWDAMRAGYWDCPKSSVYIVRWNGSNYISACLTKDEVSDYMTRAEAEALADFFRS